MIKLEKELLQATTYAQPINLSFNQYLLDADDALLVHTGSIQQAHLLTEQLQKELGTKSLSYILVSHFESDECGGLPVILQSYPKARVICSEVTARQIQGFGIEANLLIKNDGQTLKGADYEIECIEYPSEMHLWNGLLFFEKKRGILFSSDLMLSWGDTASLVSQGDYAKLVEAISEEQVPHPQKLQHLKNRLAPLAVTFIATGHGECLRV
ncbi:MAG: hypothetical protein ACOXZ4_01530 [Sphaerochaetaceae bacterium]|jgi:flavorubredoxin